MKRSARGEQVEARVARELKRLPAVQLREGVQPLNPGYFTIERLRTEPLAKVRGNLRQPLRDRTR